MGIWGGIKRGAGAAGRWLGNEAMGVIDPLVSGIEGDWRGAASGLGRLGKRVGQGSALFGQKDLGGVDVGAIGAVGGAIEGGLGPSEARQELFGETPGGGWAGAARGAAKGYGGVKGAGALHNIGAQLGVNKQLTKINPFGKGHILGGIFPDYGPTRDERLEQLMTTPSVVERLEGETDEAYAARFADAEYDRGSRLLNSGPMRLDDYSTTAEAIGPQLPDHAPGIGAGGMRSTTTGTGQYVRVDTPMQAEGKRILDATAEADPRTIRTRTAGTPLVPEGKIRNRFAAMGGPGGERYPEQQAAIEQAQWRATVPDQPDPIRTPGFYSPDTPQSQRGPPISSAPPQIPQNVIPESSYMNAPAAPAAREIGADAPPGMSWEDRRRLGFGTEHPAPSALQGSGMPGYDPLVRLPGDTSVPTGGMSAPFRGATPPGISELDDQGYVTGHRSGRPRVPGAGFRVNRPLAAVGSSVSAQENMNAQGVVPAARFGAQSAPGDVEMVGGPVYSGSGTNEYLPIPDASTASSASRLGEPTRAQNIGNRVTSSEPHSPGAPPGYDPAWRALALGPTGERGQATAFSGPLDIRDAGSRGSWPGRALSSIGNFIGDNPEPLINAAGQLITGREESDIARERLELERRMVLLREQQAEYEQDPQRVWEQYALSQRSRWA